MLPVVGAVRPRTTEAIAGRSFATQTMRGLRNLTETQLPSVRVSPRRYAQLFRPIFLAEFNTTGVNFLVGHLAEKALGWIHELIPSVAVGAMFANPNNPNADAITKNIGETARSLRLQIHMLGAGTPQEIDAAFARLIEQRIGILLYAADPFLLGRRDQVVALAARHSIPAIYPAREFVTAGGLMSYGTSISDAYRRAGVYTGKILKGARPTDLPVDQSTRFEFVINLKTANALGLGIPDKLLALADEVVE
jgi:putative tryptophan/tyrosine transport system substrate-binding protein